MDAEIRATVISGHRRFTKNPGQWMGMINARHQEMRGLNRHERPKK